MQCQHRLTRYRELSLQVADHRQQPHAAPVGPDHPAPHPSKSCLNRHHALSRTVTLLSGYTH